MRSSLALLVLLAGCRKAPAPANDAGVVATASSSVAAPSPPPPLSVLPAPTAAQLLSNGHVLFDAHGNWDWDGNDPKSARPQRLDLEGKEAELFLGPGDTFVIESSEPLPKNASIKKRHLEIWDGPTRTKRVALPDTWQSQQPAHAFSEDGSRFLYLECDFFDRVGEEGGNWYCDIGVYEVPTGKLVHRSKALVGERSSYFPFAQLSKDGRYFSVHIHEQAVRVFDSASGPRALPLTNASTDILAFVGTTVITSSDTKIVQTDLTTGKVVSQVDLGLPKGEYVYRFEIAPDREHVAFSYTHDKQMIVGIWKVGDTTVTRHPIPSAVCTGCVHHWATNRDVIAEDYPGGKSPKHGFRIDIDDAEAGAPGALPSFSRDGFEIYPETGANSADVVVTPDKKRLEFPHDEARFCTQVRNDRLLFCTKTRARVVQRDGTFAELQLTSF